MTVPCGDNLYGRVLNVLGKPIDGKGDIITDSWRPIRKPLASSEFYIKEKAKLEFEIMETGIKLIDLLFPLIKGSKTGILGGAALGKTIIILEIIRFYFIFIFIYLNFHSEFTSKSISSE